MSAPWPYTWALAPVSGQAPAANTNAVCTLTGKTDLSWLISEILWSYNGTPSSATLVISWTDPVVGAVTETYYITASGPGFLPFNPVRKFPLGATVTITLLAVAAVSGSIYASAQLG